MFDRDYININKFNKNEIKQILKDLSLIDTFGVDMREAAANHRLYDYDEAYETAAAALDGVEDILIALLTMMEDAELIGREDEEEWDIHFIEG